ncbi:hypothetical protein Ddye_025783 [Dipteronia dyeriana]|uniref:HAT C-terminal dimerisation domain-containing protein n=1 Tax=Dipteronia dyeriana TaxID=168575 RepID=A0AAD9TLT2_9ROSI|nr:hypothetical protein Ddye_025783 [Dipteronia dyeriana]
MHLNGKENKKQESLEGGQNEERVQEPMVVANHHNKYVALKVDGSRIIKFQLHLHCTSSAYYLNPKYQYRDNIGDNSDLLKAVHNVYAQLDTEAAGIANFVNELIGGYVWKLTSLCAIAVHIMSQTSSSSACERNWCTFALIHTKQRNRIANSMLKQLIYCYYNMKLKLRDMAAEKTKVNETDFMDLLQVAVEAGDKNENPIFDWVRPTSLDDDEGNPNPHIASHARDIGINVEQVIREEVGIDRGVIVSSSSDDQHTSDGNSGRKDNGDDGDGGDEARGWNVGATSWDVCASGWDASATYWNDSDTGWDAHIGNFDQIVVENMEKQVELIKIL